jgi:hypothetical protein
MPPGTIGLWGLGRKLPELCGRTASTVWSSEWRLCRHRGYHLDRGYEKIVEKLKAVGAQIKRIGNLLP